MKVYKAGWRFDLRKRRWKLRLWWLLILGILVPLILLLLYLVLPFWTTRAVLLGSDARADEPSRADTIMIAAVGRDSGMLSVPRDTLTKIPGHGKDKINAAFAYGGPDLMVDTLEKFTDLRINKYAVVEFNGVEDVVNAMGGVRINVKQPIDLGIEGRVFHIDPGVQMLRGGQALAYVRYRGGPKADIGRINRQQRMLDALKSQAFSLKKLPRLPAVTKAVLDNVDTNMNPLEAARFAVQMKLFGNSDIQTYPGTPQYIGGISYWVPDTKEGQKVIDRTIN
jgi:LCP family protein required for cell wall assembly